MVIETTIKVSDIIQILIVVAAFLVFYARMVRFFTKINDRVDKHEDILIAKSGDLNVVTHSVLRKICAACSSKSAIAALQKDMRHIKNGG